VSEEEFLIKLLEVLNLPQESIQNKYVFHEILLAINKMKQKQEEIKQIYNDFIEDMSVLEIDDEETEILLNHMRSSIKRILW
jgi:DUF438 domain-containing protein